jgi:hypothetical protein
MDFYGEVGWKLGKMENGKWGNRKMENGEIGKWEMGNNTLYIVHRTSYIVHRKSIFPAPNP